MKVSCSTSTSRILAGVALAAVSMVVIGAVREARAGKDLTIKFAALAPDGSTWMRILREADKELTERTGKQIRFKFYAGGVMGDEADVIRKMKVGQVHAGGFTGIGLGKIAPLVRVLEQPMLFRSYDEVDAVVTALDERFRAAFEEAGYVHLGWAEAGMVHLFTQKPVRGAADLKGMKMWAWEGDPVAAAMYKAFDVVPVPLSLPDVLTSLQTGIIEGVYAPPLGAIALQWHTRTKHFGGTALGYASGAVLMRKQTFDEIPAELRATLLDVTKKHSRRVVDTIRRENAESIAALKKQGLVEVQATAEQLSELDAGAAKARGLLRGSLFPGDVADEVDRILAALRK